MRYTVLPWTEIVPPHPDDDRAEAPRGVEPGADDLDLRLGAPYPHRSERGVEEGADGRYSTERLLWPGLIHPDHFLARGALEPSTDHARDEDISDNTAGLKLDLFSRMVGVAIAPAGNLVGGHHRRGRGVD